MIFSQLIAKRAIMRLGNLELAPSFPVLSFFPVKHYESFPIREQLQGYAKTYLRFLLFA